MSGSALNPSQLTHLLTLLSEDVVEKNSLEILASHLHATFPTSEAFKVASAVVQLLQQPGKVLKLWKAFIFVHSKRFVLDLIGDRPSSRLVGLVYIYEMYKAEPLNLNPFAAVFVQAVLQSVETGLCILFCLSNWFLGGLLVMRSELGLENAILVASNVKMML